jgi:hypothetical protein
MRLHIVLYIVVYCCNDTCPLSSHLLLCINEYISMQTFLVVDLRLHSITYNVLLFVDLVWAPTIKHMITHALSSLSSHTIFSLSFLVMTWIDFIDLPV